MRTGGSLGRALLLFAVDGLAGWRLRPDFSALRRDLGSPQLWVDRVGGDQAAVTLAAAALWLVALWLAVGLAAALVSYAPGALGRSARHVARFALPRILYRAAAGAAGLGVLLTPVVAGAATSPHAAVRPPLPAPTLPTTGGPSKALPAPRLPGTVRPDASAPTPSLARAQATDVVVRPGDSLWTIAAAQLRPGASDARIAAAWPRWYAANRAEIGSDPGYLTPGQALHAPAEQERP